MLPRQSRLVLANNVYGHESCSHLVDTSAHVEKNSIWGDTWGTMETSSKDDARDELDMRNDMCKDPPLVCSALKR